MKNVLKQSRLAAQEIFKEATKQEIAFFTLRAFTFAMTVPFSKPLFTSGRYGLGVGILGLAILSSYDLITMPIKIYSRARRRRISSHPCL